MGFSDIIVDITSTGTTLRENQLKPMGINGNQWKSTKNHWKSMKINENQFKAMGINENQQKNQWKSIKINGNQWVKWKQTDENQWKISKNH